MLALIDAKRGELFAALYEDGDELWEPFAATPGDLAERVRGAGLDPAGRGRRLGTIQGGAGGVRDPGGTGRIGLSRGQRAPGLPAGAGTPGVAPEAVLPHYLRAPDAKPR